MFGGIFPVRLIAFGAKALDLQEVVFHGGLEMAFYVAGNLVHEAQIDFFNPAAFPTNEMVVMIVCNVPANEVTQLAVFVGDGQEDAALGEFFEDAIDGGQADALEFFLQPRLHLERIQHGLTFQKQFDYRPHLGGDAVAVFFQAGKVIFDRHDDPILHAA